MNLSKLKERFGAFRLYAILCVAAGLCIYFGFGLGNVHYEQQSRVIETHKQSIQSLKTENEQLTKSLNILGVELEVANLSEKKAFAAIELGIQRETELRESIAFYQQVMAPELSQDGFRIDGFHVQPALSEASYRFELVLIQQKKIKQSLTGDLVITLIGSEQGIAKQYGLQDLIIEAEQQGLKFGFKYFQVIAGELKLPPGFVPEKVSVHASIYQNRRKKGELTTVFDWLISES